MDIQKKQAFLIMYHDDFYILERLLKQIDNDKFDIYLHVDKKVKDFDFEYTKKLVKKSMIYFVKRKDIKWSTFSQIKCELGLLKEASLNNYVYYHLLSGNDLLLRDSNKIYDFFDKNRGYEYIAYRDYDLVYDESIERIKYYHLLNQNRRHKNEIIRKISNKIYYPSLTIQKELNVNRLKNNHLEIRKGANWFSITDDLVKYILTKEKEIAKMFKYSNCGDELFLQTFVYNSKFRDKVYRKYDNELMNVFRYIDWERGEPYTFTINEFDELMNSGCFFARKFSTKVDREIIDKIYENYKKY